MLKKWLKNRIQILNKKVNIRQYFYFALLVYILGIIGYLTASYFSEKHTINNEINDKLLKSAQSIDYLLPMNYHDRAINRNSINDIEFNEILQLLTFQANNYNIKYLYTLVEQNGKLYITSSSATNHEMRTGQNLSYYWQEYSEADKAFYKAFETNINTFVEYTDRWGTFRTVIIPRISLTGKKYLACADIDISYIDKLIWKKLVLTFFKAIFFTLIILPLFHVLYKYHKKVTFEYKTELSKKELKVSHEEELKKHSIQVLRQVDEKFQALFYNSPLPMIILSQNGKVIDSNKACQDFLGISKFELNDHIIFTLPFFNSVNDFEKIVEELNATKKLEAYSIVLDTKKGNRPCKIWGTLLESQQKPQYIFIIQDVSSELKFFKELEEAKKIAEEISSRKSSFIANISHEIRTPLNAIIGFADLLKEESNDTLHRLEYIDIISSNSKSLLSLINDLIDFSKIEAGQLKITEGPCYLNQMLSRLEVWANEEIKRKKLTEIKIERICALSDAESIIITDEVRLNQVILNLLNNSLKFTEKGTIRFGYNLVDNTIQFFVIDSGLGMSKEDVEIIFERFGQGKEGKKSKYGGAGLGLSISKRIVELLGGEIWVESELNKGTAFYFTIGFKRFKLNNSMLDSDENNVDWTKFVFIIAEKDLTIREFLVRIFERNNSKYFIAEENGDIIEFVEKEKDVNVLILDLNFELNNLSQMITYIKHKNTIKLIATSSNPYLINIHKTNNLGFDAILSKPYNKKDLEEILRNW